jgi:PAT family beta-lactamase induction signal transducer AmpG
VVVGLLVGVVQLVLPNKGWMPLTLGLLLGIGLISATHDIAADGFYMLALGPGRQAAWSGVRSAAYRVAVVSGTGGLVWLAGRWETVWGVGPAWTAAFVLAAVALLALSGYHGYILPWPAGDERPKVMEAWGEEFVRTLSSFVQRPGFLRMLGFMLFYRIGEGQLLKGNLPFFLAARTAGGLGLSTEQIAVLYGTLGTLALLAGGIAGGLMIARTGLGRQIWWMAAAMNLPHVIYVWLAWAQPESLRVIGAGVVVEQLGYGYGFAAYMVYLLYVARGAHPTAHYALCTGVMAFGLMLAGYVAAGALEWCAGDYRSFFVWIMVCSVLSFATLWKLPLERDFGRREVHHEEREGREGVK